jgi:aerobic-type carbon monoxide dehydrogenase small subunit (CoxS/CutS family)
MPDAITITVNGAPVQVPSGVTVAVALTLLNEPCRTSVTGQPRGPLCAMGICYECRVTIDRISNRLACQTLCVPGMEVSTHA